MEGRTPQTSALQLVIKLLCLRKSKCDKSNKSFRTSHDQKKGPPLTPLFISWWHHSAADINWSSTLISFNHTIIFWEIQLHNCSILPLGAVAWVGLLQLPCYLEISHGQQGHRTWVAQCPCSYGVCMWMHSGSLQRLSSRGEGKCACRP